MSVPSFLTRLWRRTRYCNTLNTPYLSGDFFRTLCDAAFEPADERRRRFRSQFAQACTIFIKTDLLPEFLEEFAFRATACRVLITGNSDLEIRAVPDQLPPRLRCWFAQNSMVTHHLIRPLPIGLENQELAQNGVSSHYRPCSAEEIAGKRLRMFAAFGSTVAEREGLLARLAGSPIVEHEPSRLAPRQYQERLRQYRFVVAPRGNGADTHRFWEALYADAIPVTRRTALSAALRAEGIPMVEVDEWDELLRWTEDDLNEVSRSLPMRPSANPWLWDAFWRSRIAALRDES